MILLGVAADPKARPVKPGRRTVYKSGSLLQLCGHKGSAQPLASLRSDRDSDSDNDRGGGNKGLTLRHVKTLWRDLKTDSPGT